MGNLAMKVSYSYKQSELPRTIYQRESELMIVAA